MLGHSSVIPSGDFETYSAAGYYVDSTTGKVKGSARSGKGGLPVVGTPQYVGHPSAEVLCFAYDMKDGEGRRLWVPAAPNPVRLFEHIERGGLFAAWNVTFEWYVWNVVCARLYGWPPLPLEQCRCDMAKARRFSLPGKLDTAAKALGTVQKDARGNNLVRKLTRPHTPTKARPGLRWTPANAWDDFQALYAYCLQDVATEDAAAALIPDLTPTELEQWQTDQRINARGVQVDVEALDNALAILEQADHKYTRQLREITGGAVQTVGEVAKLGAWLHGRGVPIPNLQAETVREWIGKLPPGPERRTLEIRNTLGAANVKKLLTLKLQVSPDGRLRDQYIYCGADRTGRASTGGVQMQNITAKGPSTEQCEGCNGYFGSNNFDSCPRCGTGPHLWHGVPDWPIEAVETALEDMKKRDLAIIEKMWGDPVTLLSGTLRGMFTAAPGCRLICCDFTAIEAVVAACLSRCQWRIDVFSTHGKIYEASASKATGIPLEDILAHKEVHGTHHPARKTIGKVRELAGGYGGWIGSWLAFGAGEFMTEEEIKQDVLKWRSESPEIVEMWGGQFKWCGLGQWDYRPELHGLEGAAIQAIQNPGKAFSYIDITYGVHNDVLYCRLPSGKFLHYHRPRLVPTLDRLNRGPAIQITFEGYNTNSTKGPVGWVRMDTYGARLFENVVQAVAAELQFGAISRCEAAGYPIVMHTHDEPVAEVAYGRGSVAEMVGILEERPPWAAWWPIRAGGWEHPRYQKD